MALIGPNGAGKTTLLRILASELEASRGGFEFGHNTTVGYYAQALTEAFDLSKTAYEQLQSTVTNAEVTTTQMRGALGAMLFGDGDIDKKVHVLSGGEKARLALAQLLVSPANVMLMDEPTNHLDLASSERLTEALSTFDGTLLFVSHNRAFLRALATRIWTVEAGVVTEYAGSFDDYLWSCANRGETPPNAEPVVVPAQTSSPKEDRTSRKERKREEAAKRAMRNAKLRPLRKRAQQLEQEVQELEAQHADLTSQMADPTVYQDAARRDPLFHALRDVKQRLDTATNTWLEVQESLEKAEAAD